MALYPVHRATPSDPAGRREVDAETGQSAAEGPTVPRQRRDAYTLYAEVYALRLDLDEPDDD